MLMILFAIAWRILRLPADDLLALSLLLLGCLDLALLIMIIAVVSELVTSISP
jgi:hypothetical protein